jgi:hypothetical protein
MPTLVYSLDEFRGMHGGNPIADGSGEWLPDGACINRAGQMYEPPTDPVANLRNRRHYIALKLKGEVAAFHAFKASCQQMEANRARYANRLPTQHDAEEQLARGKERIDKLRAELAELDSQLPPTADELARRGPLEQYRATASEARARLNRINNITI